MSSPSCWPCHPVSTLSALGKFYMQLAADRVPRSDPQLRISAAGGVLSNCERPAPRWPDQGAAPHELCRAGRCQPPDTHQDGMSEVSFPCGWLMACSVSSAGIRCCPSGYNALSSACTRSVGTFADLTRSNGGWLRAHTGLLPGACLQHQALVLSLQQHRG